MNYVAHYHNYVADPEVLRHANETRVIPLLRGIAGFVDSVIEYADEQDGRGHQCVWVQTWASWDAHMARFEHPDFKAADAIIKELFLLKPPEQKLERRPV